MAEIQLETSRLFLRPIELSDSPVILKYRSDAEANKYQGWVPKNLEDVHDFICHRVCRQINQAGSWFQLGIIRKDSGELIGDIGIHFLAEEPFCTELGITVDQEHWNKGFANEALSEVITFLFLRLGKQKIIVSIDPRNKPSIKLFERLGFVQESYTEKSFFLNGEWVDDLVMGLQLSE